jgi:hypothetical protein
MALIEVSGINNIGPTYLIKNEIPAESISSLSKKPS